MKADTLIKDYSHDFVYTVSGFRWFPFTFQWKEADIQRNGMNAVIFTSIKLCELRTALWCEQACLKVSGWDSDPRIPQASVYASLVVKLQALW